MSYKSQLRKHSWNGSNSTKFEGNIQKLLKEQIIALTVSHYNNSIQPIKKLDECYRFTVDYGNLDNLPRLVGGGYLDIGAIRNNITTGSGTDYMGIDSSDMFLAIPVDKESHPMTAFT